MTPTIAKYVDRAETALASGFASEAKRKEALSALSTAYDQTRRAFGDRLISEFPVRDETTGKRPEPFEALYWGVPMELHNWKPKTAATFAAYPEFVADCDALAELRAAIKAAPVEPKPIPEDHPLIVFAKTSGVDFAALRDRRSKEYDGAVDLGRRLGGLPISVERIFCVNYARTTWVRLDWFLNGRRVAFQVVAAAYQKLVDEGVIVEER